MKHLVLLIRWIVGLLFIFSGIVKTIDPIGFSYKLEEYFSPWVFDMPFFASISLELSIFFVIFEVLLGVLIILGIWRKFTLWSLIFLIVFFTFLTFYSAYFNKVTDCGCFGDAVKLKPWESFGKDLILAFLILILWLGRKYIQPIFARPIGSYIAFFALLVSSYIAFHGIYHLPIKDFRPYAEGKNIIEGMRTAEELGLKSTQIEMVYHLNNKLNGQKVKVSENQYLKNKSYWSKGTPWEIIKTEDNVIEEGYEPPIHDFVIDCPDNGDMTYHYLNLPKLILIVTPLPHKASLKGLDKVSEFADILKSQGFEVLSVASNNVTVDNIPTCLMDATTLKTMIRSNPGIILLKQGTVVDKYHWHDIPTIKEVEKALN